jgi:hypothetical protein
MQHSDHQPDPDAWHQLNTPPVLRPASILLARSAKPDPMLFSFCKEASGDGTAYLFSLPQSPAEHTKKLDGYVRGFTQYRAEVP